MNKKIGDIFDKEKLNENLKRANDAFEALSAQMEITASAFRKATTNNLGYYLENERQHRLNRKWQRIFIALIITNIIIYSQII